MSINLLQIKLYLEKKKKKICYQLQESVNDSQTIKTENTDLIFANFNIIKFITSKSRLMAQRDKELLLFLSIRQ